jgi:hypothetical protein
MQFEAAYGKTEGQREASFSLSEESTRITPYFLTSLDISTAAVLKNLMIDHDYSSAIDNLKILAATPGDEEIMTLAENHVKETNKALERLKCQRTFTMADEYPKRLKQIQFLKERSFDLYWQLRKKMKEKGYLRWSSLLNDKGFRDLESKAAEDNP